MSGADHPEFRLSDADREQAVTRLNDAVAEGRLTLGEFEERVTHVLQARTESELTPLLADLPEQARAAPEEEEVRANIGTVRRVGHWVVPRRLRVHSKAGTVKLDLTGAEIRHPRLEVVLDSYAATVTLVLPRGATVDVTALESGSVASQTKVRTLSAAEAATSRPHVVVSGRQWAGTLVVRHQYRFLWWRW